MATRSRVIQQFRYSENWNSISKNAREIQPLCTNNPFHGNATVVHHLKYTRSLIRRILGLFLLHSPSRSVAGHEIPGWDCVPVCQKCHANYYGRSGDRASVHHPSVWKQKGGIENHQSLEKTLELRIKFFVLFVLRKIRKIL